MSEQKMREALERIASEEVKNLGSARILAREALAQQPAAVVELTDMEILGFALEGFCISTQYGQSERKLMPISDSGTLKDFARAVIAADRAKNGGVE